MALGLLQRLQHNAELAELVLDQADGRHNPKEIPRAMGYHEG